MISKNRIDEWIVRIALLFPITILLQGMPAFSWINKCIVAVLVLLMVLVLKDRRDAVIIGGLCGVLSILSLMLSNRTYMRLQDIFYFPLFILYCLYWEKRHQEFESVVRKNLVFGAASILLWCLMVVVSVFFPSSFAHGGLNTVFFMSFSNNPFRLASSCVIIMLMLHTLAYYKNKKIVLLEAVPLGIIFSAGTRVFLVVGVGIFLLSLYLLCSNKRLFWLSLLLIIPVMIIAILNSSIVDKFILVAKSQETFYGNYWDAFTSGRSIFWRLDLEAFFELPFYHQLIGKGISFPYEVTAEKYVLTIWAHNDFINVLMAYGWIGLALYFYCFFRMALVFQKSYSISWFYWLCAVGLCMFNAFINGLYFYSALILAIPFLFYAMSLQAGTEKPSGKQSSKSFSIE